MVELTGSRLQGLRYKALDGFLYCDQGAAAVKAAAPCFYFEGVLDTQIFSMRGHGAIFGPFTDTSLADTS